jgi:hypothetical protein
MRNDVHSDTEPVRVDHQVAQSAGDSPQDLEGLPNRLLTIFEVAKFVGCHEETVRVHTCADCSRRNGSA